MLQCNGLGYRLPCRTAHSKAMESRSKTLAGLKLKHLRLVVALSMAMTVPVSPQSWSFGDPGDYTCLLPMKGDQSLGESVLWHAGANKMLHKMEDVYRSTQRMDFSDNDLPNMGMLSSLISKEAAEECTRIGRLTSPQHLLTGLRADSLSSRFNDPLFISEQTDRAKEGLANLIDTASSQSLPQAAPHQRLQEESQSNDSVAIQMQPCSAKNGSYCLVSLAKGQALSSLPDWQLCALNRTVNVCPPGFYCKGGEDAPRACSRGTLCPGGSATAEPCPAGHFCPVPILKKKCLPGAACHGYNYEPGLCGGGYYCPDAISIICPEGHFCPPGSRNVTACARFASCPEGSELQSFTVFSRFSLSFWMLGWWATFKTVPMLMQTRNKTSEMIVAVALLMILGVAWCARLDLLSLAADQLSSIPGTAQLTMQELFGSSPHATALLYLSLACALMAYGLLISSRIQSIMVRTLADAVICPFICLAFSVYLQDSLTAMFVLNLWFAFRIVWLLLTQQGSWMVRLAFLGLGFFGMTVGFFCLGAPEAAQLLILALLLSQVKEAVCKVRPRVVTALRQWRLGPHRMSILCDTPLGPLIDSLATEPFQIDNPEANPAVALRVTAAANASLEELESMNPSASGGLSICGGLEDREAAEKAWADYGQSCSFAQRNKSIDDGVSFDLRRVSYVTDEDKRLLRNISFVVPGGSQVAIMGASGAGKTTLLNLLSGRCGDRRLQGEMRLNAGIVQPSQMAALRPLMGFVPQDDMMHHMLTARENIFYQAELRLGQQTKAKQQSLDHSGLDIMAPTDALQHDLNSLTDAVLNDFGLSHIADRTISSGISGGQRKRVSIGMEVVTQPRVLLLDEPSSGLDSSTAQRVVQMVLGKSKEECRTTLATIHQPRWALLNLFDMLVLLAPGGHLCYAGPVVAVRAYFSQVLHISFPEDENPADIIIDVCTFDSARLMATEGVWRSPPQCLRALLFPLPEVVNEGDKLHWQQEEFGKILGKLWADFAAHHHLFHSEDPGKISSQPHAARQLVLLQAVDLDSDGEVCTSVASTASSGNALGLLGHEAHVSEATVHWARHAWIQFIRALLIMSRVFESMVLPALVVQMICAAAVAMAFPDLNTKHIMVPPALLILISSLMQSVSAQRIFGGSERDMALREAGVFSLAQTFYSFVGRDLASIVEILMAAGCFTLIYWPMTPSFMSGSDMFAIAFALFYAIWGMNHILAIALNQQAAMVLGVVTCFLSFLCAGVRPAATSIMQAFGGYGKLFMLASPMRWAYSLWLYRHFTGIPLYQHETIVEDLLPWFGDQGFKFDNLTCPNFESRILDRWLDKQGLVCHSGQLFLLGFLFRFVAAVTFLVTTSSKTTGGPLPLGVSSSMGARLMRDALIIFISFFIMLQILILGQTY